MKVVFLALFLLPLFAVAQTTTDENKYGKIELLSAIPPGSGVMSQASVMLTNMSKHTLTFTVRAGGYAARIESVQLAPGQNWLLWVSPWRGNNMTVLMLKDKNGKPVPGDLLYIDVPASFPERPVF